MSPFSGFPSGKVRFTPIPAPFFTELLPQIDQLGELKVTLYALWFLDRQEGQVRFLTYQDFAGDQRLLKGLGTTRRGCLRGLERMPWNAPCQRGTLIRALAEGQDAEKALYFSQLTARRAAVKAWQQGKWTPDMAEHRARRRWESNGPIFSACTKKTLAR